MAGGGTGGSIRIVNTDTNNNREGYNADTQARQNSTLTTNGTSTTPIVYSYDYKSGTVIGVGSAGQAIANVALLADPANRQTFSLDPVTGFAWTTDAYINDWAKRNAGKSSLTDVRNLLIGKGYLQGTAAQNSLNYGTRPDPDLLAALGLAVSQISMQNHFLQGTGTYLSIEEGLKNLQVMPSSSSSSGSGSGGTYTQVNKQIFNKADYKLQVDDAYKAITGQAADDKTLTTFVNVLQHMANKNPEVSITKVSSNGKNRTTTTKGGLSPDAARQVLLEQALKDPNAQGHQKAGAFMDYFMNAIKENAQ